MDSDRRKFLVNSGTASLGLGLRRLVFAVPSAAGMLGVMSSEAFAAPAYTGWKDVFRKKWTWDKIVHSTHQCNCFNSCSWKVYVRNGIVWREEQTAAYRQSVRGLPDFNPQGCQKGATYSREMYSPTRIKYPLKRVGERGEGKWKRISWDEALTEIARKMIEIVRDDGHDTIITSLATQSSYTDKGGSAKIRFTDLIGGTIIDGLTDVGDGSIGAMQTAGQGMIGGSSDSKFISKCVILWVFNPNVTKIPDAHFIAEARYNGTTIISISPDQNPSHIHTDIWMNPKQGTDIAIALAMAHLIVKQKLYDEAHMKEQTDLPFLVREDTQKYLRESDMVAGGSDQVFYFWDSRTNRAVTTPGSMGSKVRSIALGDIDPVLEGHFEVALADGKTVKVTTVFEKLKPVLDRHTPEFAQEVTGVGVDLIKRVVHEYATRKPALIQWGMGMGKLYHGDLLQRSIILLAALTGNVGKEGGGYWSDGVVYQDGIMAMAKVAAKTGMGRISPPAAWFYVHGGLREASSRWVPVPEGKRTADDYIMESIQKMWMPVFPPPGKSPRAMIECGSNVLRRTRMTGLLKKELWPKLKLVLTIDMRMSTTALNSDYVLPCAGYYETEGIKYPVMTIPFHSYKGKVVEHYAESKDEWQIFALLCKKIQELAPGMGITNYKDVMFGFDRDLGKIYDEFTENGKWDENVDDSVIVHELMDKSAIYQGVSLEEMRKTGFVPWTNTGNQDDPSAGGSSEVVPGQPITPLTNYTEKKKPWHTLAGRQQFYIDHDWFIEFGEQLPVYKDAPAAGGNHPFRLTSGHTRWAIHSTWRDNDLMLRQQRGEPVAYINSIDAAERGIKDHDMIEIFNDIASFKTRAYVAQGIQRGQIHTYHAWEQFQHHGGVGVDAVSVTQVNPLNCVGNYGHLRFMPAWYQPNNIDKGTRVDVRKI